MFLWFSLVSMDVMSLKIVAASTYAHPNELGGIQRKIDVKVGGNEKNKLVQIAWKEKNEFLTTNFIYDLKNMEQQQKLDNWVNMKERAGERWLTKRTREPKKTQK